MKRLNANGFCQLAVDIIPAVFDGDYAVSPLPGNHGDGFTGVATKGKQKRIELFVIRFDPLYQTLFAQRRSKQIHRITKLHIS